MEANPWTDAQLVVQGPSNKPFPNDEVDSPVFERLGGAMLDDLEPVPIRAVGIGLFPLVGDRLGDCLSKDVDREFEAALAPLARRRLRGRASAS